MSSAASHPSRVLVVEDDLPTREILALLLGTEGYEVSTAADGRAALEQLRTGDRPEVVILDLMMPVMGGWEFRAEQRRDPRLSDIPVIVCSAAGRDCRPAALGAVAYLDKPVDPAELVATVGRFCHPPTSPER